MSPSPTVEPAHTPSPSRRRAEPAAPPHRARAPHWSALRASLARPDFYPHHPGAVELRETHISCVFLAGGLAYKLKKPLVLPFLDYGTPERRRQMCLEEVRLNRRLAPDVYLGVRGVSRSDEGFALTDAEDPQAIEFLVEMRTYDENRTLSAALNRGELTREEVANVGRTLAGFHVGCPASRGAGGARQIEREIGRNVEELARVTSLRADRDQLRVLARFLTAFIAGHEREFDRRSGAGLTREGHGDLRAEHVLLGSPVRVVDCVEFDRSLRTLDVADDLAFLVMDLASLGGERFAAELVDRYREAGGDCGSDPLLAFFAAHRALVRAKVLLTRAAQLPCRSAAHGHASAQARELLVLADRFSWQARRPLVIVVCGVPASGKSSLGSALAHTAGLPMLSSDRIRKSLAEIGPFQRASAEHYRDEFSRTTYRELGLRAAAAVTRQGGAVVDATFRRRADRDAFARAFRRAASPVFVECLVPEGVLLARGRRRAQEHSRVSDADLAVVQRERGRWEPLDEVSAGAHLALRTDRPTEDILADLRALLDSRLAACADRSPTGAVELPAPARAP
jgi:uncharacterized protein